MALLPGGGGWALGVVFFDNRKPHDGQKNDDNQTTQTFTFASELKQITTFTLAILIFLQPLSKMWIVVSFKINQDKIAQTICVMKETKNNTCQGKCHLKKQLEKAGEEEQKQLPKNQKENYEVLYYYGSNPSPAFEFTGFYISKLNTAYSKNFHPSCFLPDIFQPPKLSLM